AHLKATAADQTNLYTWPLDELATQAPVARQLTSTPGFKANAQFTPDGKEIYYTENGRINDVTIESRAVRGVSVTAELDAAFAGEMTAVFEQAWSILRDNFFDSRMNGVDWNAVRAQYEPLIAGARNADEARRIMRLMVGELNASHSGIDGPSFSPQANVGR